MNCPKCQLVEMRVDRVENDVIHYVCKKCGEYIEQKIEEIEEIEENEGE